MKRIGVMLAAALAAAGMGNLFQSIDIGKLEPVRLVYIQQESGKLVIATDTGEMGMGDGFEEALAALKESASAEVFLDTADFLLLDDGCIGVLGETYDILRPGSKVCVADGSVDIEAAGDFLSFHRPGVTLAQCRSGEKEIPVLRTRGGRMELVGKTDQ